MNIKSNSSLLQEIRSEYTIPFLCRPRIIKKFFGARNKVALDLGSNVSGFSIIFNKNFHRIISVEPSSKNVKQAENLFIKLGISNTKIYNRALATSSNTEIILSRVINVNGNYRNSDFTTTEWETKFSETTQLKREFEQKVKGISVDELISLINTPIDFCKCDVEGAEYEGFLGKDLSLINFLVLELHYDGLGKVKTRELIDHLEKYFDYYRPSDEEKFKSWPPPQILRLINKSNKNRLLRLGGRISHRVIIKFVLFWPILFLSKI